VRGRVLGIWSMMLSGGLPAGGLLAGWAADAWGERAVFTAQALLCGTLALTLLGLWALWRTGPVPVHTST
jgi:MFS family permease